MTISSSKALSSARDRGISSVCNPVTHRCPRTTPVLAHICDIDVGNGIINADGDLWKLQRKAALPFFSNANLKIFVNEVLPPFLTDTEKRLEEAASRSDPVDMQDVFLELTTRLMGKIAYDVRVNPVRQSQNAGTGSNNHR
jgi:hypothetical protein